jgi:ribosomal protein S18 acetylase RimI-like enzyme
MTFRVEAFNPGNREDFFAFHSRVGGECFCTAWWVPSWEEWAETNAESNRQLREELLKRGEYDGYLLYAEDQVVGWCQVGQRDRLAKILSQFNLTIDPNTWAITCFQINPEMHREGLAANLLRKVLKHLQKKGVARVEVYPKMDTSLAGHQQWTGPLKMYEKAGFSKLRENKSRAVYEIQLQSD